MQGVSHKRAGLDCHLCSHACAATDNNYVLLQDTMISHHEVVENGPGADRCQVVRWIRSFPFSFIKKREYIIARKVFRDEQTGCIYGITKAIEHPRAAHAEGIIRMNSFHSMWRSRTIPDPNGSDRSVLEVLLPRLSSHQEHHIIRHVTYMFCVLTQMKFVMAIFVCRMAVSGMQMLPMITNV